MTWSLFTLCLAASAAIVFTVSAATGVGLALGERGLARLTPAAEARVLLGAALLPMLAGLAVMTAAMAPSFGWILDHCAQSPDMHDHPHLCADHHVSALPAATLVALGLVLLVRVLANGVRLLHGAGAAALTRRALERLSLSRMEDGTRVLPLDEPQAFVLGALAPTVFVTRGLLAGAHREHLEPALSHERAHLRRRDPLRRCVATIALAFHLPGIAASIERRLGRAQEMAADAEAARAVQSPERVATALVRLTRAHTHAPRMALAFGASDVEARVATLLDRRPRHDRPHPCVLVAAVALLFVAAGTDAGAVHHGVEILLGLLGG